LESTVKLHIVLSRHFSGELVQQDSPTLLNVRKILTGYVSRKEGYYQRPKKMEPSIPQVGQPWYEQTCSLHTLSWRVLT